MQAVRRSICWACVSGACGAFSARVFCTHASMDCVRHRPAVNTLVSTDAQMSKSDENHAAPFEHTHMPYEHALGGQWVRKCLTAINFASARSFLWSYAIFSLHVRLQGALPHAYLLLQTSTCWDYCAMHMLNKARLTAQTDKYACAGAWLDQSHYTSQPHCQRIHTLKYQVTKQLNAKPDDAPFSVSKHKISHNNTVCKAPHCSLLRR